MKKLYVKSESGSYVLANEAQLADASIEKFEIEIPDTAVKPKSEVQQLTELIHEMAASTKESAEETKKTVDDLTKQVNAYKELASKGFPLPKDVKDIYNPSTSDAEVDDILKNYNLAKQGKRFYDNMKRTGHEVSEEARNEMAKYYLLLIKGFGHPDYSDPRALDKFKELYGKTALGDAGNLFPIPDIVDEEILWFMRESSVALQDARIEEMTSEKLSFPQETGQPSVSWGNTTPASDGTASEVELTAVELSAYSTVRNMTLADARSDIVSWINAMMSEAAGQELDNQVFNGDGSTGITGCYGTLSASCGYSVAMGSGSTAFSNLTADLLSEMIMKLDGLKKTGAKYYMNGVALHYVRILKDSNGQPIFLPGFIGTNAPPTIFGYPYRETIKITGTTAANTAFILFGNLRYFLLGRRLGATALQIDPWGLWTTNRTRFKIYQRWGGKMGLPTAFVRMLTAAS